MIDRELVTRKLVLILEDLRALAPLAAKPLAAYLASPTDEPLAERYLERAIGRMIDVNFHLLVESGEAPPNDYYTSFVALSRLGILRADFARRLAGCAGLRNRIVHEYDELDPAIVHAAAGRAVLDIPRYLQAVQGWLDAAGRSDAAAPRPGP